MKPSWMTYGVLSALSRKELLKTLKDHGFEGVEFRTDADHGHKVEATIDAAERRQVVAGCEAAGIRIVSVATGNRYHDTEASELGRHIAETKLRMDLAADLGAPRVRVFGNNFPDGVPRERTIGQVAEALKELCAYGEGIKVKPCLELHGEFDWRSCQAVARQVDHSNFGLIWNSVSQDVVDGSVRQALDTVWPWLDHVHMHDLAGQGYPYRELFELLYDKGYDGYMSAEAERSADRGVGDTWMFAAYYGDLFRAYRDLARKG